MSKKNKPEEIPSWIKDLYKEDLDRVVRGERPMYFRGMDDSPLRNVSPEFDILSGGAAVKGMNGIRGALSPLNNGMGNYNFSIRGINKKIGELVDEAGLYLPEKLRPVYRTVVDAMSSSKDKGLGHITQPLANALYPADERRNRRLEGEHPVGYVDAIDGIWPREKYGLWGEKIERKADGGSTGNDPLYVRQDVSDKASYLKDILGNAIRRRLYENVTPDVVASNASLPDKVNEFIYGRNGKANVDEYSDQLWARFLSQPNNLDGNNKEIRIPDNVIADIEKMFNRDTKDEIKRLDKKIHDTEQEIYGSDTPASDELYGKLEFLKKSREWVDTFEKNRNSVRSGKPTVFSEYDFYPEAAGDLTLLSGFGNFTIYRRPDGRLGVYDVYDFYSDDQEFPVNIATKTLDAIGDKFEERGSFEDRNPLPGSGKEALIRNAITSKNKLEKKWDGGYIGGSNDDARERYVDMDKKLQRVVYNTANDYGINPNLLMNVIGDEGAIDEAIRIYNKNKGKVGSIVDNEDITGNLFELFGLDDVYTDYKKGLIKTKRPIKIARVYEKNELGRSIETGSVDSVYDAIELMAAELVYRRNEVNKRFKGLSEDDKDTYAHVYYNRGIWGGTSYIKKGNINKKYKIPEYLKNIDYSSNPLINVEGLDYNSTRVNGMDRSIPFENDPTPNVFYDNKNDIDGREFTTGKDYYNPNLDINFIFDPDNEKGYRYTIKRRMDRGGDVKNNMQVYDEIWDYLTDKKGIPQTQAIGILSNIAAESGGDTTALGAAGDFGIQQWLGPRKKELQRRYGKKPTLTQQLDYLVDEYQGKVPGLGWNYINQGKFFDKDAQGNEYNYYMYSKSDFDNAVNYKDATVAWNQGYGRPLGSTLRNEKRFEFADMFANRYGVPENEPMRYEFGQRDSGTGDGGPQPVPETVAPAGPSLASHPAVDSWWEKEGQDLLYKMLAQSGANKKAIEDIANNIKNDPQSEAQVAEAERMRKEQAKRQLVLNMIPGLSLNIKGMSRTRN